MEQIERAIRLAALLKFNYAILEPWGMYKSEKHPWWSWPKPTMTKGEIRRLVKIGKDLVKAKEEPKKEEKKEEKK